jgi:hypothetical protein
MSKHIWICFNMKLRKKKTKPSKGDSIGNSWLLIDYIKMLDP